MSLGTQPKALDAAGAKQADQSQAHQPKWDVNHREVLNQIKQDRAGAHPEVRAAVAAQPHREVQQQQTHPRPERPVPNPVANRPEVAHPVQQQQRPHPVQQQQRPH